MSTGPYNRNKNSFYAGTTDFKSSLSFNGKQVTNIDSINRLEKDKITMFTDAFCNKKTETSREYTDIVVINNEVASINYKGNSLIPGNGFVLSISKKLQNIINEVQVGDDVKVKNSLGYSFNDYSDVTEAGRCLVRKSKIHVTTKEENFQPDIAKGRAPRTAFGLNKSYAYFVVVDERRDDSTGMTLEELAGFMKNDLNVEEAVNFDGGGSSEIVVNRSVIYTRDS